MGPKGLNAPIFHVGAGPRVIKNFKEIKRFKKTVMKVHSLRQRELADGLTLLHPMLQDLRPQNLKSSMVAKLPRLLHKYIMFSFCGDVGMPRVPGTMSQECT